MGVCILFIALYFVLNIFVMSLINSENTVYLDLSALCCFGFCMISLKNKVGPVGNRHDKITLHEISMLRSMIDLLLIVLVSVITDGFSHA